MQPNEKKMVTVTIDGVPVTVPDGTLLVEASKQIKRDIPVYCYHEKLGPAGLCRICLVEIEKMPKLQIACNTPVTDGMVVHTMNDRVNDGRRAVLEFLLLNHPLDCPICDKGGECDLQDYSMAYGQGASRLAEAKTPKPKAVDLGPTIVLDEERCILCLRCVRFDDIITGERSLRTDDRGAHAIIATATGQPYVSDFSGNVTELCPVGALTSKTYRFKSRPWDNHRVTTTCTQCSVGCQMHLDERANLILRAMNVEEDDAISDGWLCDRGRYNLGYIDDERRLTMPLLRSGEGWTQIGWDDAIAIWAERLQSARSAGTPFGAIGGGRLLNEEALLLAHVYRVLGSENLDWRAGRQRQAHPGARGGTHVELQDADAIVTYGRPPAQLAPILDLRIRKAVSRRGVPLISIGDHAASKAYPTTRVDDVAAARAALPATGTIAFVWDGTETTYERELFDTMESLVAEGRTVRLYICGEQPNARGAESMGMLPGAGGLDTQGMLEAAAAGKLSSLALFGVNPMLHYPDRALVERALAATPFVVATEMFMTETAERAHLILPVCSSLEKNGTVTDLAGDVLFVTGSVQAREGVWADGDVLVGLADALRIEIPTADAIERRVAQLAAAVPPRPATSAAAATASSQATPGTERLRLVVSSAIFTGGGTAAHDVRVAGLVPLPQMRIAPPTAAAAGVNEGDVADLTADDGSAIVRDLVVTIANDVPQGAVAILDGLPGAPANRLGRSTYGRVANVRPQRILLTVGTGA